MLAGRSMARACVVRTPAIAVMAVSAILGLATPASAHNRLLDSIPCDNATLSQGPATIELTFDQPCECRKLHPQALTCEFPPPGDRQ
jgi:methionine-rich copper-binding protein CopC